MVETSRIRVAVLEGQYACLVDQGVPFSVCLRLQQLGLELHQAQWTARNSLGGFSISFFWPSALEKNQPTKKVKKVKKRRVKVKSPSTHISPHGPVSYLQATGSDSPKKLGVVSEGSPIDAHHDKSTRPSPLLSSTGPPSSPTESPTTPPSELPARPPPSETEPLTRSPSASTNTSPQVPNLSKCQDVRYESRNYMPGVSYKSVDGKDEWTPVIRRKRKTVKLFRNCSESESSGSDSEVDVSCSRKVEYEKRDGIPGLNIYRRGPAIWTPIQAATKPAEPIAARTRSKTSKT